MRVSCAVVFAYVATSLGCSDGASDSDAAAAADTPDAALTSGGNATPAAWAAEWIEAYDRQIAATCPCLVPAGAFASAAECMTALGSGPTWLTCATAAVADAGVAIDAEAARCLVESSSARAACFEQAACDATAMSACLEMPNTPMTCPPIENDVVVLLLERCPDLGLLSR